MPELLEKNTQNIVKRYKKTKESALKWALFALFTFVLFVALQKFVFQVIRIEGNSMQFSLYPEDVVFSYKWPLINLKRDTADNILDKKQMSVLFSVMNKAVIVNNSKDEPYISRCIAIAGDKIEWKNREILVNNRYYTSGTLSYPIMFMTDSMFSTNAFLNTPLDFPAKAGLYVYKGFANESIVKQLDTLKNVRFVEYYGNSISAKSDAIRSFVVPYKGFNIELSRVNQTKYMQIIHKYETKDLGGKCNFTFSQNYIMLCNDMRNLPASFQWQHVVPATELRGILKYKIWGHYINEYNQLSRAFLQSIN